MYIPAYCDPYMAIGTDCTDWTFAVFGTDSNVWDIGQFIEDCLKAIERIQREKEEKKRLRRLSCRPQYPTKILQANRVIPKRARANLWSGERKRAVEE